MEKNISKNAKATKPAAKPSTVKPATKKSEAVKPAPPAKPAKKELSKEEKATERKRLDAEIVAASKAEKAKKETERKARLEAKKAEKPANYLKQNAVFDAIKVVCKKGATYTEIYDKTKELYKLHAGADISEKMNMIDYSLYILCSFGIMEKIGKTYKLHKLEGINLNTVFSTIKSKK